MKAFNIIPKAARTAALLAVLVTVLPTLSADRYVPTQYATIQAAINAADPDGDTIHIEPGVYVEQLLIVRKHLILVGKPGAIIRAKSGMIATLQRTGLPDGGVDCTVPLLGAVKSQVVLQGLTFEGEHLGEAYPDCSYSAIIFSGTGGSLKDCTVRGFRYAKKMEIEGYGFSAANDPALITPPVHIDILRCTFEDNGISLNLRGAGKVVPNSAVERLNFTIADNTITGIGSTSLGPQVGLWIGAGASGEVKRNTIKDHFFSSTSPKKLESATSPTFPSMGVVGLDIRYYFYQLSEPAALLPVTFEDNIFLNNELQLALFKADGCHVIKNSFQGAGTTFRPTGLILSGKNALVTNNRFYAIPTGITLLGKDPDWGTRLGAAANPQLLANQFCEVTTPIETQSLATGVTEQGTELCSIPALTIASAVSLSWSDFTGFWVLDSAPSSDGPWTRLPAASALPDGQYRVIISSDAQHRFFRLRPDL